MILGQVLCLLPCLGNCMVIVCTGVAAVHEACSLSVVTHLAAQCIRGRKFYSPWMHCRLFTAFASEAAKAQQDDDDKAWQAAFKLSYDVGSSVLRGRRQLPALGLDRATCGSHLMQLALQHQQLVAAPQPVAGQGAHTPFCCALCTLILYYTVLCCTYTHLS